MAKVPSLIPELSAADERLSTRCLCGLAGTCLFTLNARARESRRADRIFHDPFAEAMVDRLTFDAAAFDGDWVTQMGVAVRTEILDEAARAFIATHPRAVIINLGAGLCTRFFRVDNGEIDWVDVDGEAVTELKRRLLGERSRYHLLVRSVIDDPWQPEIRRLSDGRPVLFIAEGLLQYLTAPQVRRLVIELADDFPGAEALLEVISPFARAMSRWQPSLRAAGVRGHWGVWTARVMESWSPRLQVVDERYYDRHLARWRWVRYIRWLPCIRKLMMIAHLRFEGTPDQSAGSSNPAGWPRNGSAVPTWQHDRMRR